MRHVTRSDGVGHPPNGRLVGGPLLQPFSRAARKRGARGTAAWFPLPRPRSPLSAVSVSHPLEGFSHLAPVEPRALYSLTLRARWRTTGPPADHPDGILTVTARIITVIGGGGGCVRVCRPTRGLAVAANEISRGPREQGTSSRKRTALFGRGVRKTTPTSFPLSSGDTRVNVCARARARARARMRACTSLLVAGA